MKSYQTEKNLPAAAALYGVVGKEFSNMGFTFNFINEVDMTAIHAARESIARENRPSYNAYILRALALTLKEYPYARRQLFKWPLLRPRFVTFDSIDIGVAMEQENEADMPVAAVDIIRDADRASVEEIFERLKVLRDATPENNDNLRDFYRISRLPWWLAAYLISFPRLVPSMWKKYRGTSALISVPSKFGVDMASGRWHYPIGVSYGFIKERPVVIDGAVTPRKTAFVLLNFDRRLVTGAQAARFFRYLCDLLENPERMA
jgi:pyruvate/2-oxoglutarate dehydrogenase complex dihydrolipoamide acyltransferase (E2) component